MNYTSTTFLTYNKTFAEKHDLNLTLGQSFQKATTDTDFLVAQQFASDKLTKIASAAVRTDGGTSTTQYTFLSYFARANYKFNNRYLFGLSGRVDGSSRFGINNRYGFFPAVSAGWIVSEESFLKENKIVSFLKLRASYGIVGNAAIPNNLHQPLVGAQPVGGTTGYVGIPSLRYIQIANPDLTWETTAQTDIGIDFGILRDRITGEIDYYHKNTTDLLLQKPIPSTSGFTTKWANVGSLKNYGVEVVINSANLIGDFKWNTSFNFAINRNEITSLGTDTILDVRGSRFLNVAKVGQPIGTFYGREYAGVNPENGDALYYLNNGTKDANGNRATTNNFNLAKDVVLGNPNPNWIGGITNTFSYKGVELSVLLQWVQGNMVYNAAGVFMSANFIYEDNQTTDQARRWQKVGDKTDVPQLRLYTNNGSNSSSRYLSDASYLRVRNVQLAYNLPTKWISRAKLSSARVYVVGQNLFTFTSYKGWDPEVSADYLGSTTTNYNLFLGNDFYSAPQIKSFTVGVNVGF
jgi:TonB-linked SusC/RagA family outer membrane protein